MTDINITIPSPEEMAEDTAQELYRTGYNLQHEDHGIAFDNALDAYFISDLIELSEKWYEQFEKYFQILKEKEDIERSK